jgi:hypothetical protein
MAEAGGMAARFIERPKRTCVSATLSPYEKDYSR